MERRIFISHSWAYNDQYEKIVELIGKGGIKFYNHSVPKDDPVHTNGTDKELYAAIEKKINEVGCVVILAGVYSSYSKWIKKEIEIAKRLGKPVVAVELYSAERTSSFVKQNADHLVKWQSASIASAIRST